MKRKTIPSVLAMLLVLFVFAVSAVCQAAPSITDVNPTSADQGDTSDVRIRANDTTFEQGVSAAVFSGPGITVNSTTVADATHATANITIDADAATGVRDVNVITGAEAPTPLAGGFTVMFSAPTVTSIMPSLGNDSATVDITNLAGTRFRDGARVLFRKSGETDIEASGVTVVSAEKITCTFNFVGADDGNWDVVVINNDEQSGQLKDGFEITNSVPGPAIKLIKTGPDEATQRDTITYTFSVQNTGNDTLNDVGVTDTLLWQGERQIGQLRPGGTSTFEQTYTIPDSTTGLLENNATATGTDRTGTTVTDSNNHLVEVETALIQLLKVGPGSAQKGDTITYTFTVYNMSSEGFTDVTVTDPLFGGDWSYVVGDLAALSQASFSQDYTIPDSQTIPFTNTATVTATDAYGLQLTDTSSDTVYKPGSCTVGTLAPSSMPPNAWWVFLMLLPVIAVGAVRWRRSVLSNH